MVTVAKAKTQTGLCTTCIGNETCAFPKFTQPKIFCEEFDGNLRNGHVENPDVEAILAHVKVRPKSKAPKVFKGLCTNCEIREACTFPKAEGGIWHCEEYR